MVIEIQIQIIPFILFNVYFIYLYYTSRQCNEIYTDNKQIISMDCGEIITNIFYVKHKDSLSFVFIRSIKNTVDTIETTII